ncbi:MAG: M23 family metallopeptidase [Devosia nanyangense]|uniref:M23 family metallopeptidase n=1 Tax=Devosia nanyangense TaxID=1228055 RepID=A0A933L5X4_9HYPH|nr:M23 family metallopeptidase [Devosia nanyangense]
MNPAQRNRTLALVRAGFEDGPALTVASTDGEIPQGRELSFAWLTGTVMTGLTSVLLMGAALYVSFQGQDTFSTAYEALQIVTSDTETATDLINKTNRVRPVTQTRSELEIVEASIKETVNGRDLIKKQPFVRIRATLATASTALSEDVPAYDPESLIDSTQPIVAPDSTNTAIYGAEVEGEVQIKTAALPATLVPPRTITDQNAEAFVRQTLENFFSEGNDVGSNGGDANGALAYAAEPTSLRDLGVVDDGGLGGEVENVTVLPKSAPADQAGLGRTERILTVKEPTKIEDMLLKNGFTAKMIEAISGTLTNVYPSTTLPSRSRLRILFGASRTSDVLIPYRLSIYVHDDATNIDKHAATVALTDRGSYVLGLAPSEITFPEADTEEVNVSNLPTVYRAIWETARKHDIDDTITRRIVAMYAYDVDLSKKISPGDSIEVLETEKAADGKQDLLFVALKLGSTVRQLYRFRTDDGTVDFYDPDGETGKRFLTRRPVQGGGRMASRFGWRIHPIFKTRRLHTGVDLAAPYGTPIYAAGDGIVEKAGWSSGYGRFVSLKHVNGYATGYGHMSRIADTTKVGAKIRQGQIIGYVGSTGNSTGNHLHFEIKVNGRFVDPLSVKLPRDHSLPTQDLQDFRQTIAQINDLMKRDPAPVQIAAAGGGTANNG